MDGSTGLTCDEALTRLDDYLDRELTPDELPRMREHLLHCAHCAEIEAYERSVLKEIRKKLTRLDLAPGLLPRILRRIAQA